ncbi:MAG: hypothetical protein ACSHW0_05770 [Thalassotalea sp.]
MSQVSIWQEDQQTAEYAELSNALYERELRTLALMEISSTQALQGRLKSLPYYIKRTALLMTQVETPLILDVQNASWSHKQSKLIPLTGQAVEDIWQWYDSINILPGLVVPIRRTDKIVLDSIDRIDQDSHRFRTNANGWFDKQRVLTAPSDTCLLKPNKKVMMAACAGHCWNTNGPTRPNIPSLRELLLSCAINWRNFKQPLVF